MIEAAPRSDPFAGVVLNHDLLNWSDPLLDADAITMRLLDFHDYYDEPEYGGPEPIDATPQELAKHRIGIEKKILFDAKRPNWGGSSKWGKPYFRHMLSLIKLSFPDTDITPSLADAVMLFCMGIGGGNKKLEHLIGSQNSGKSAGAIRIAFAIMIIDPEYSAVFVANPFDNAADSTVWGDVEELWDQLCEHHSNDTGKGYEDATWLFPWGKKYANRQLDLVPGLPKAGTIVLRNVKHVGKFKGSKGRGKDVTRGVMLLLVDEVNEIENPSFETMLNNLVSQDQFFAITSQNFKDEEDMGGRLTQPVGLFGGPSSFDDLDIEFDVWWHSSKSSITLRFDGHRSPNVLANRTIYPKLFKMENLQRMRDDYGVQSPDYYSQVRSFPVRGDETNSVLSRAKLSASRHKDTFFSMVRVTGRVAFCDPAFGGRDKAVFGWAEIGQAYVTDGEGKQELQELFVFKEHFRSLKLVKGAWFPGDDNYWPDRMKACGMDISDYTAGAEISYEDQIAVQCRELCLANNVPFANFGYDFSMRPDIVSSINKIMGFNCLAFDYNQGPEGHMIQNIKKTSDECCKNRCTELAFLSADLFLTRQVRGGSFIETATTQLSRTLYQTVNRKYVAEGKREYKARWQQVSPDHRDVLMGLTGVALKRGFRQSVVGQKSANGGRSVWDEITSRGLGKKRIVKRV